MEKIKSYFLFSREHRSGIFSLLILIIIVQIIYYLMKTTNYSNDNLNETDEEWLLVQDEIDSIKKSIVDEKYEIKPFNPNFITDYKGYMLGMSIEEIDRLHEYRKSGKFINSSKEFQEITKISDELLMKMQVNFKFPDWVTSKKSNSISYTKQNKEKIVPIDLNLATKEQIMKIYGIGDKISDIILKEKMKLGTFATIDQLQFIWGITPEIFEECKTAFFVSPNQNLNKIKINEASIKELAKFPYFNYAFAKEIVTYRSMNGVLSSIEDLAKINNCPLEKLKIIALYLEF